MYVLEHIFRHYDTQTCIINKYVIHLQPKKQQNNNPINNRAISKTFVYRVVLKILILKF